MTVNDTLKYLSRTNTLNQYCVALHFQKYAHVVVTVFEVMDEVCLTALRSMSPSGYKEPNKICLPGTILYRKNYIAYFLKMKESSSSRHASLFVRPKHHSSMGHV